MQGKATIPGLTLAAALALAQLFNIIKILQAGYIHSTQAAWGVATGYPHWRVFQNRILGPYLVKALQPIFDNYLNAHLLFSFLTLLAAGYLAWQLGGRIGGRLESGLLALLIFHLSLAFILVPPWLYAWDYVCAIAMLLFTDFVLCGRTWPWFAGLFGVAVFNRESALFIALWMMADPVIKWYVSSRGAGGPQPFNKAMAIAGAVCFVAGLVVIETLRQKLLIEEVGPRLFADVKVTPGKSFALQWGENLKSLAAVFGQLGGTFKIDFMPGLGAASAALFALGYSAFLGGLLAWKDPYRFGGLAVFYAAVIASIMLFGVMLETRIYIELTPLLIVGSLVWLGQSRPAAEAA